MLIQIITYVHLGVSMPFILEYLLWHVIKRDEISDYSFVELIFNNDGVHYSFHWHKLMP